MAVGTKLMTAEEFWQRANEFSSCELVRGIVVPKHGNGIPGVNVSPTGGRHGEIELRLGVLLSEFVRKHNLGAVYIGEVGFVLRRNPDMVRAPDVAFVSAQRLGKTPEGFIPLAPDLAIEIASPSDSSRETLAKAFEYLGAGTRLVWLVAPDVETVIVYRSPSDIRMLKGTDALDGSDVLPGFSVQVNAIFE